MSIVESRAPIGAAACPTVESGREELSNGDNLSRDEFMRIWEQLPSLKKAELIDGVVFVPSPLRLNHGLADSRVSFCLTTYSMATPFTECAGNVTWFML